MGGQLMLVLSVATCAAAASPLGGLIAVFLNPSTLLLSILVGYAGGVLIGTFAFEMMPKALEQSSLLIATGGFALGFGLVYALDFYVNRGALAGPKASQKRFVEGYHRRRRPRGSQVTVLAGATSVEELIEGLTIGVGSAIDPTLARLKAYSLSECECAHPAHPFQWPGARLAKASLARSPVPCREEFRAFNFP